MSNQNKLVIDQKPKLLNDPGEGFQSRDVIYTIAKRLVKHTYGKIIGGYELAPDGKMIPSRNPYAPGSLTLDDAMYAIEYSLTRGLNPYGHISLWYQRLKNSPKPQLIIEIDYKVLKGWAEWMSPFRSEHFPMTDEERQINGLKTGDLGSITYNVLDSDVAYLHQYQMKLLDTKSFDEAQRLAYKAVAKSRGVGVVKANEMKYNDGNPLPPPKGRTWQWRAETRSFRDAVRRSHGEPPPALIKQYMRVEGLAIDENHLALMSASDYPDDIPVEDQERYLKIAATTGGGSDKANDHLEATELMRDNGDDDPLGLDYDESDEDETEAEVETITILRDEIAKEAAKSNKTEPATDKQLNLISEKLNECFAGQEDANEKSVAVLTWLLGKQPIQWQQAVVLMKYLISEKDEETGDFVLNPEFARLAQDIYIQHQKEAGQLELL